MNKKTYLVGLFNSMLSAVMVTTLIANDRVANASSQIESLIKKSNIHGSVDIGYFDGDDYNPSPVAITNQGLPHESSFDILDARIFISTELAKSDYFRASGFEFEWNLIRTRETYNFVGEAYLDIQGIMNSDWLSMHIGRFQLPVTENYLRFSAGQAHNPFVSHTAGGLWYWDEGLKLYGNSAERKVGYIFSITDGESNMGDNPLSDFSTEVDPDFNSDKQYTLRLFSQLTKNTYVSATLLHSGEVIMSSLWFGEASVKPFGMGVDVDNFVNGVSVADGPMVTDGIVGGGVDLIYDNGLAHIWLNASQLEVDSPSDLYDRTLSSWVLEFLIEGRLLNREWASSYFGIRASGIGTYESGEGYLFDRRYMPTIGFNMESYHAYSVVLGKRFSDQMTLRIEYTDMDISLVDGATASMLQAAEESDYFGLILSSNF